MTWPCRHQRTHPSKCDDCGAPYCTVCSEFHHGPIGPYVCGRRLRLRAEAAEARIAELESRRPVVCETCHGFGRGPGIASTPCPDCGKDGCGPGVRFEVKP